jgi:hypothetical protein
MTSQFTTTDINFQDQTALQQRLINFPEEDRFNEINAILDRNVVVGLKLVNLLKNRKYFNLLLERGLEKANASEIEIWLKYLVPHIGFRRVIAILSSKLSEQPDAVDKALYWLPKFLPKGDRQAAMMLENILNQEKLMLGKEYKSVRSSGKPYKLILRIKSTGEYAVFGGYTLGSKGTKIIVEILNSQDFYPTGGVREVSPGDMEVLDPQPYDD